MEIFRWNTGAQYAPRGQEIEARVDADGVEFVDYCRGICGRIDSIPSGWPHLSAAQKRQWIHKEYLHNSYKMSCVGGMWERPAADQFPLERM